MSCLTGTVGIIGCGTSSPASGILLNSFPGMSLDSIDGIADANQIDYRGVWDDVESNAYRRFLVDVAARLTNRYSLAQVTSSIDTGYVIDSTITETAAAQYRGFIIDANKNFGSGSEYKNSSLQSHYVQSISFYSPIVQNATAVIIKDAFSNVTLMSTAADLVIGWNTISINANYPYSKIAIGIDSTNINSVSLKVDNNIQWSSDCSSSIEGIKWGISSPVSSGIVGDNSYGMTFVYGTRCSYESLVCSNKDVFYQPWSYLLAIELTVQRQFSTRINRWSLNKKEAEDLRLYYEEEYRKSLDQVCDSLNLNMNDCCLECDGDYTIVEHRP